MPAGVGLGQYIRFSIAAFLAMAAGSQIVHMYYKPLNDIDVYVEKELEAQAKK